MRSLRGLLVLLILLATTGFVIGVAIERSSAEEPHTDEPLVHEEGGHEEGEATVGEVPSEGDSSETVLGLNVESTPLVVTAVVFSLVLAGAAWAWPRSRPLLVIVIVIAAMLAFAVLDIAEVAHQLDTARAGLAILAAIVAALHLGAAGTSGAMLKTSEP